MRMGWVGGSTRSLPSVKIPRLLHQRKTGRPTISPGCRVCVPHLIGQSGSQTRKEMSIRDIQRGSHYREVVFTGADQLHAAAGCTATDCSRRLQGKNQRHTGSLAESRRGSVSSTAQVVQLSALQHESSLPNIGRSRESHGA